MPPRSRLLILAIVVLGVLTWTDFYLRVLGPTLEQQHFPTSTYWVAPRLVLDGQSSLLYADPPAFEEAAEQLGARRDRGFVPNAPPAVIPLLPFGLLPESVAYPIWTLLSLGALLAGLVLVMRAAGAPTAALLGVIALLPLFHPMRANYVAGQAFAFVLLAIVGGAVARSHRWRDSIGAGIAFGIVAVLKLYYGLTVLVPAIINRQWRTVLTAMVVLVSVSAFSLLVVGIEGWATWLESALGWRARPEVTVTAYQTLTSLFGHLLRFEPGWNEGPIADLPVLADGLWWISLALLTIGSVVAIRRGTSATTAESVLSRRAVLPVALLVPVALLTSPIAEDYHYVLALFPVIVAATILWIERPRRWLPWLLFGSALLLLAPAWPFANREVDGWWALLFYPRVYGALALWGALLWLAVRNNAATRHVQVSR